LQCKFGGFGFACGKSAREPLNLFFGDSGEELNAG
jgi:hypothetical protein